MYHGLSIGSTKKPERAVDLDMLYELACCFECGAAHINKSTDKAILRYYNLAKLGHTDAQYSLAYHHSQGIFIRKSEQRAIYWYTKAAEQGHTEAKFILDRYIMQNGKKPRLLEEDQIIQQKRYRIHLDKNVSACSIDQFERLRYRYAWSAKKNAGLIFCIMLALACVLLAKHLFDENFWYFFQITGKSTRMFEGIAYKWPVLFIVFPAIMITFISMQFANHLCLSKLEYADPNLKRRLFLRLIPSYFSLAIAVFSLLARWCIGMSSDYLQTGCIIKVVENFEKIYNLYFIASILYNAFMVYSCRSSQNMSPSRHFMVLQSILATGPIIFTIIMLFLDLRIQSWLGMVYLTIIAVSACIVARKYRSLKKACKVMEA